MAGPQRTSSNPHQPFRGPGVTLTPEGAYFRVYAGYAWGVEVCIFGPDGAETRHPLERQDLGWWSTFVPGVQVGARYGYRVDGPWDPASGHRYNKAKLLLDPYARAVDGALTWGPQLFGHNVDDDWVATDPGAVTLNESDSAPQVPCGVIVRSNEDFQHGFSERDLSGHDSGQGESDESHGSFDWDDDRHPMTAMADTVIYEGHVRGLTALHPDIEESLRGTYAGIATPTFIHHLKELGVTALELLPVHTFVDEPHLIRLGLTNYWGYNTLNFFAPHAGYAASTSPQEIINEFKSMVKALHAANIEVILDVVYNHSCEQAGNEGVSVSLRGFDNRSYYRLGDQGFDFNITGCGNSLDVRHPVTVQLILDSLRYWVTEMHVDGFRFDLGVTLGRAPGDEFDPGAALLMALRSDPVLSRVKLIAEPWDVGPNGWQTGNFPAPFAEWNDRFRGTVRDFWLTDVARSQSGESGSGVADLATRISGSRDLFGAEFRHPQASINYVIAHDGFTLADLTNYNTKHNEANGEENRDGSDDNRSWNHGHEGPTDDADITNSRYRTRRNILGTLLLSVGTPMLTAGDEIARTQQGNNNAYCQDNSLSWVDWHLDTDQHDLIETTKHLLKLRAEHPVLRHGAFFQAPDDAGEGAALQWFDATGAMMTAEGWHDASARTLQAYFDGAQDHEESLLVVFHGDADSGSRGEAEITLPAPAKVESWHPLWDSNYSNPRQLPGSTPTAPYRPMQRYSVTGPCMLVFRADQTEQTR